MKSANTFPFHIRSSLGGGLASENLPFVIVISRFNNSLLFLSQNWSHNKEKGQARKRLYDSLLFLFQESPSMSFLFDVNHHFSQREEKDINVLWGKMSFPISLRQ